MKTKFIYGFNPQDSLIDTIRQQGCFINEIKESLKNESGIDLDDLERLIEHYETLEKETKDFIDWAENHIDKYAEWLCDREHTAHFVGTKTGCARVLDKIFGKTSQRGID